MTDPTTAEERAAWLHNAEVPLWERRLIADVERLEAERDKRQRITDDLEGQVTHAWAEHKRTYALMTQFRLQRDEAVKLLHMSRCIGPNRTSNADYYCWMHGGPKEEYCPRCTFLAGLSTVTKEDWAGHQQEESAGKTVEELREKYGLCERVTVCCQRTEGDSRRAWCDQCYETNFECSLHKEPWPDEGDCPEKEKVG